MLYYRSCGHTLIGLIIRVYINGAIKGNPTLKARPKVQHDDSVITKCESVADGRSSRDVETIPSFVQGVHAQQRVYARTRRVFSGRRQCGI